MRDGAKLLNWSIGGYIAIKVLAYSDIVVATPSLRILFVLAPASLLVWQAILLYRRLIQKDSVETEQPFYERLREGDWWRIFLILWIGHSPLATDYLVGFVLFSAFALFLLGLLVFTASAERFRKKKMTSLAIGCLAFGFCLLIWEKGAYVEHYGVPIIGHFFEKPEYQAKYKVKISPAYLDGGPFKEIYAHLDGPEKVSKPHKYGPETVLEAIADIQVKVHTETVDSGEEDRFGQSITHRYTYSEVWVKKLYLPDGEEAIVVNQDEPLHLGDGQHVRDVDGRWWFVHLLNEPVH